MDGRESEEPQGSAGAPADKAAPERFRLSMQVGAEEKKAVEVVAKLANLEYGEVLRTRSLQQVVADYKAIREMVLAP
jgi:hypothetical protein